MILNIYTIVHILGPHITFSLSLEMSEWGKARAGWQETMGEHVWHTDLGQVLLMFFRNRLRSLFFALHGFLQDCVETTTDGLLKNDGISHFLKNS